MKWNQLVIFVSFAIQQVCAIETYVKPFTEYISINDDDVEKGNEIEKSEILLTNKPVYRSFSNLYETDTFHVPRKMKKVVKMNIKKEEDFDLANPLQKRLDEHTGAIVPYKAPNTVVPHKGGNGGHSSGHTGPAPRKGIGKGAKIAAGIGGVVALGGATYAGAKALIKHNKNKQSQPGPQLVKRARGGRRKRIAAQNRANEAAKTQPSTPPTKPEKSGMGNKTKAGLLIGAGVAAGAGAMAMTGGGGGNQVAAPAAK